MKRFPLPCLSLPLSLSPSLPLSLSPSLLLVFLRPMCTTYMRALRCSTNADADAVAGDRDGGGDGCRR